MIHVKSFTFNPFSENTYVLYNPQRQCVIIDPGCYEPSEKLEITTFIKDNKLNPVRLLNTHCHIDHVLGNKYVAETFNLQLSIHKSEKMLLDAAVDYGANWGIFMEASPSPATYIDEKSVVDFGKSQLKILHTPGHSPGSICFYSEVDKFVISGDVLFRTSIGRTDLPGGNHDQLLRSISDIMFALPDDTVVYSGHGPSTTIGYEKEHNPFMQSVR